MITNFAKISIAVIVFIGWLILYPAILVKINADSFTFDMGGFAGALIGSGVAIWVAKQAWTGIQWQIKAQNATLRLTIAINRRQTLARSIEKSTDHTLKVIGWIDYLCHKGDPFYSVGLIDDWLVEEFAKFKRHDVRINVTEAVSNAISTLDPIERHRVSIDMAEHYYTARDYVTEFNKVGLERKSERDIEVLRHRFEESTDILLETMKILQKNYNKRIEELRITDEELERIVAHDDIQGYR